MTEQGKSTHVFHDEEHTQVSPNLWKIVEFLEEISKEIDIMLGVKSDHVPIRSQMILLFSALEVMYYLYTAYTEGTDDDKTLLDIVMQNKKRRREKFLNRFLLSANNRYYKSQIDRFRNLSPKKIIYLRNSLTHFYSLGNYTSPGDYILVCTDAYIDKIKNPENSSPTATSEPLIFMSPTDLHELIKAAFSLVLQLWSNETLHNKQIFEQKIACVNNVVNNQGGKTYYSKGTQSTE